MIKDIIVRSSNPSLPANFPSTNTSKAKHTLDLLELFTFTECFNRDEKRNTVLLLGHIDQLSEL